MARVKRSVAARIGDPQPAVAQLHMAFARRDPVRGGRIGHGIVMRAMRRVGHAAFPLLLGVVRAPGGVGAR